jgi:hypothetical protein
MMRVAGAFLERLESIERRCVRWLELAQPPAVNALAIGTVTGQGIASLAAVTELLPAKPNRLGLSIQNRSPVGWLAVGLGSTAPVVGSGLMIAPGQSWDGRVSGALWLGSVSLIADQVSVSYSWLEARGGRGML